MLKLLALLVVTACAHPTVATSPAQPFELQPVNETGAMTTTVSAGSERFEIGLAVRDRATSVVRLDGTRKIELFAVPRSIAGIPASVRGFDYAIDPGPKTESDLPGRFTLVASASTDTTIYTATWVFTWSSARGAFDVGAPEIGTREVGRCDTCDARR